MSNKYTRVGLIPQESSLRAELSSCVLTGMGFSLEVVNRMLSFGFPRGD